MHKNTAAPANCRRMIIISDSASQHSKSFMLPWVTNYADRPQRHVGVEQRGTTALCNPIAPRQEGAELDLWPRPTDIGFSTLLAPALHSQQPPGQRNPAGSGGRCSGLPTSCYKLGSGKSLDHVVSPCGCGNKSKSKYSQQQVLFSMLFYRDSSSYKEQIRIATNTVSFYLEQVDFSQAV